MNAKQNALEAVHTNAELYYDSDEESKRNHGHLVERVKVAKENGATQQEIADACVVGERKLSRQRIAQFLQEK